MLKQKMADQNRIEKVTLTNGEEKEVKVGFIAYATRNKILGENIKVSAKGQDLQMESVNYFGILTATLEATIRDVETGKPFPQVGEIIDEDGDRIFNKYFEKMLESIGGNNQGN